MRPSNFPSLRLAYGSQIILRLLYEDLFKGIVLNYQADNFRIRDCYSNLKNLLEPDEDYYWSKNYFFSKPSKKMNLLLGSERLIDIIIDVIIPFVYLYSITFENENAKRNVISFYDSFKIKPHNSVLQIMENQLLGKTGVRISTPAVEQAAIQLYNFYCTRRRCNVCGVGKSVFGDKTYDYKIIFY
jgi:hypothetical protein